ncbi:MAG: type II secretion system major pseudopilin GspG [Parasphingorhabdus sp.]
MKVPKKIQNKNNASEAGFTLMEMLVVLVVIGLIAAVAIPQITKLMGSAKSKATKVQMETLSAGLRYYEMDVGAYPSSEQGLEVLWSMPDPEPGWSGPYLRQERQLKDPWNRDFLYRSPVEGAPFELVSLGADGKEGGMGEDADIKAIP